MLLLATLLLVGTAIWLLSQAAIPALDKRRQAWQAKKEQVIEQELDKMFSYGKNPKEIVRLYYILPFVFGTAGWLFFRSPLFVGTGVVVGLFIPNLILRIRNGQRRMKFNAQLLDAIMVLSSSLKSGLSLLQGLEVIAEEMPAPLSQEIGLLIRENRMGISLEEALKNLDKRMDLEELKLVVNTLLVARETGGDFIKVLSRLTTTIRDNRRLKEMIRTLTLQGKMQGFIMSALPFLFIWWVLTFNRGHFNFMLQNELGRMLLIVALILQAVGMFLIKKFSTIKA